MLLIPKIYKCRSCGGNNFKELLKSKYYFPDKDFQIYVKKPTETDSIEGSLTLLLCKDCNLVQLKEKVEPTNYKEYIYVGTPSRIFRQHLNNFTLELVNKYGIKNKRALEIGCSDGYLLNLLRSHNNRVIGFEPSQILSKICRNKKLEVICAFFQPETVKKNINTDFDCIIIRHTLEHINDLDNIFKSINMVLTNNGILVIEVPYLNSIIKRKSFSSFELPHKNYFTLNSLNNLLNKYGLFIHNTFEVEIGGGSIVVIAKKTQSALIVDDFNEGVLTSFLSEFNTYFKKVYKVVEDTKSSFDYISAFGASDRAYSFLNFANLKRMFIKIYDSNSYLWGHYLGGFNYFIENPAFLRRDNPDCLAILATSYENEIIEIAKKSGIKNFILLSGEPRLIKIL